MAKSIDWNTLEELAWRTRGQAYAPYSKMRVGAAVLAGSGKAYRAAKAENASFGLTLCAERNALATAIGHGERQFNAMLIVTHSPGRCMLGGACRQGMAEFTLDLSILCVGANKAREKTPSSGCCQRLS